MRTLGLYLHIPFCRSKCLYCDFYSLPHANEDLIERYVERLICDLKEKAPTCRNYTVDTVYIGGGTPTTLPTHALFRITQTLFAHYHVDQDAEITIECNPKTGDAEMFRALRQSGINRLSVGLQSVHEDELKALGRLHTVKDFENTYTWATDAGFENISVDLMFGIPKQTTARYLETLSHVLSFSPTHISAYGLIVEEGTPFCSMGERLLLPDEEETREMYFAGIELLSQAGLSQYEISNFARDGYASRHNLKYWSCEEYLGFGPGAYSDFSGARFGHNRDLLAYIDDRATVVDYEEPTHLLRANEYVMLRMRLSEGVVLSDFSGRFGLDFDELFGQKLLPYERLGLILRKGGRCRFTSEGMYLSNAVLSELLDFSDTDGKSAKSS